MFMQTGPSAIVRYNRDCVKYDFRQLKSTRSRPSYFTARHIGRRMTILLRTVRALDASSSSRTLTFRPTALNPQSPTLSMTSTLTLVRRLGRRTWLRPLSPSSTSNPSAQVPLFGSKGLGFTIRDVPAMAATLLQESSPRTPPSLWLRRTRSNSMSTSLFPVQSSSSSLSSLNTFYWKIHICTHLQ
jgi:hypothetical protein